MQLRPIQEESVRIGLDYFNGKSKDPSVLVLPTAYGKSLVISNIANQLDEKTIVFQPSKELLEQNFSKLVALGGHASIYSASVGKKEIGKLTYATIGSVKKLGQDFRDYGVKYVIADECDTIPIAKNSMYQTFLRQLGAPKVLGLTATPIALKTYTDSAGVPYAQTNMLNRTVPKYFKKILQVVQNKEMLEWGYWSKIEYELYNFDDTGLVLNSTGAEFTETSVSDAVKEQGINNTMYLQCKELLKNPKNRILIFMDSVENAHTMSGALEHTSCVEGKTKKKEREAIVKAFREGTLRCLTNYSALGVGFDVPELTHIFIGRPTNSIRNYWQWVGRLVRVLPSGEIKIGVVKDFGNNVQRFGKIEDFNIEEIENYGWGLFNNDQLLSGMPMDTEQVFTKEFLKKNKLPNFYFRSKIQESTMKYWFGKFKGKFLHEAPMYYIQYILKEYNFLKDERSKLLGEELMRIIRG